MRRHSIDTLMLTARIGATKRTGTHRDVQHVNVPWLQPTRHKKRPESCQRLITPQTNVSMRHENLIHCLIRRVSEAVLNNPACSLGLLSLVRLSGKGKFQAPSWLKHGQGNTQVWTEPGFPLPRGGMAVA
jgi:hypothetical protein